MTPTPFSCPNPACGKRLRAAASAAGKSARCHGCGTTFRLEKSTTADGSEALVPSEAELPLPAAPPPLPPPVALPAAIGRFRILGFLGGGAFGDVYRAHDPELDRTVAVKVPKRGTLTTPMRVKRFLGDAKAAARLRHPHIVPVFDVGEHAGSWFIASAFVGGRTLAEAADAGLPLRTRVDVVRRLADALDYAHSQGVIHRDVKPLNVMLDAAAHPHLIDFGLAKLGDDREGGGRAVMGTAAYMSPEQAAGRSHDADAKSDQYSLGVTLYELLGGQTPFSGPPHIVLLNVMKTDPPPLHSLDQTLPLDLVLICRRAMAKEPAERYASCGEFADDLRRWLDGETPRVRRLTRRERLVRWVRKEPRLAGAVGLAATAVLLAAVLGVAFGVSSEQQAKALAAANGDLEVSQAATADQRDRAKESAGRAAVSEREAQKALASAHYDRAVGLCESGEVAQGMNWFLEAIRQATAGDDAYLERAARLSLSAWAFEQHTVARVLPLTFHPKAVAVLSESAAVAAGDDGKVGCVALFDPRTGEGVKLREETDSPIRALAVPPGGGWFATGDDDGTVQVWKADATRTDAKVELKSKVNALAVHPTKNFLLAGCDDGYARLISWTDGPTGPALTLTATKYEHEKGFAVYAVAFHPNPDTPLVLTGSGVPPDHLTLSDHLGEARQFHADTAKLHLAPVSHPAAVLGVAYRPDGRQFATATGTRMTGEGRVWATNTHLPMQGGVFPHIAEVNAVGYDPRGRFLYTAGQDRAVRVRDAITFRPLGQPMRHAKDVRAVAILGDRVLAVGDEDAVRIWDIASGPQVAARGVVNGPLLAVRPTEGRVWLASPGLQLRRGELAAETLKLPPALNAGRVRAFDARADRVAAAGDRVGGGGYVALFDPDGTPHTVQPPPLPSPVLAVGLSADGKRVAAGCEDGRVAVWGGETDEWTWDRANEHTDRVYAAVFNPDGSAVLTCARDNTARLWDPATGKPLADPIQLPNVGLSAVFTDDGHFLVGYAGGCRVFQWAGGDAKPQAVGADLPHQAGILFASVDPHDRTAVTGGTDGRTRWWDLSTGKPIGPGWGMTGLVRAARFVGEERVFVADTTHRSGTYREYALPAAAAEPLPELQAWVERSTGMRLANAVVVEVIPAHEWRPGPATAGERAVAAWRERKPAPPPMMPAAVPLDPTPPAVVAKTPEVKPADPPVSRDPVAGWVRASGGVVAFGEKGEVTIQFVNNGFVTSSVWGVITSVKGRRVTGRILKTDNSDFQTDADFGFDWAVQGDKATLGRLDMKFATDDEATRKLYVKSLEGDYRDPPKRKQVPTVVMDKLPPTTGPGGFDPGRGPPVPLQPPVVVAPKPGGDPPKPPPVEVKPKGLLAGWTRESFGYTVVVAMGDKDQMTLQVASGEDILATVDAVITSRKGDRLDCKVVKAVLPDSLAKVKDGSPFGFDWVVKGEKATLDKFTSEINEALPSLLEGDYTAPPKPKLAPPDKPPDNTPPKPPAVVAPKPSDLPKPPETRPTPPEPRAFVAAKVLTRAGETTAVRIELGNDGKGTFTATGEKGKVLLRAKLTEADGNWWVGLGTPEGTGVTAKGEPIPDVYTFEFKVAADGTVSRFACQEYAPVNALAAAVNGKYAVK